MKKLMLLLLLISFVRITHAQPAAINGLADRKLWLSYMDKVARPVMTNLAENKLKEKMTVALSDRIDNKESRTQAAYLEAFGRTLCGIAPWLQLEGGDPAEVKLRNQYRGWALKALNNTTNPKAKDYLQWKGGQELVDASFVAFAIIRCPWLWDHLDAQVKQQIVDAFKTTRATVPVYSNWILFSGMIEAFFSKYDLGEDPLRTEFAIREFTEHWYVGDGMYSDGMEFHYDYYNSIVIQPNLGVILQIAGEKRKVFLHEAEKAKLINQRYAEILERLINTDGTFPATGRSLVYRGGAFHHLSNMAYLKQLPASLPPAQVRCALTAVIKKTMGAPRTFTPDGWLTIGLYGDQPGIADFYITTGSVYFCSTIFVALGLPETDEFWSAPPLPWTAVKVWNGMDIKADHAMDLKYH